MTREEAWNLLAQAKEHGGPGDWVDAVLAVVNAGYPSLIDIQSVAWAHRFLTLQAANERLATKVSQLQDTLAWTRGHAGICGADNL